VTDRAIKFLDAPGFAGSESEKLAYKQVEGQAPTLIWCGGLKSDMEGNKALFLHSWAIRTGQAYIRFDYFGHGQSTGRFRDGTISRWSRDIVQIIDGCVKGDVILVGSSMGGWSSLLAARARPERVKGLVLINPAPDFTEKLIWANWPEEARRAVVEDGIYYEPSNYDDPCEYSRELINDGRTHQLLDASICFNGPVRVLQGLSDTIVPWDYAYRVVDALTSTDVTMTLIKGGDHSLSRPEDLTRLRNTVTDIIEGLYS